MNEESFKKEILDFEDKLLSLYATKNCEARRERETTVHQNLWQNI